MFPKLMTLRDMYIPWEESMKMLKIIGPLMIGTILLSGCQSSTKNSNNARGNKKATSVSLQLKKNKIYDINHAEGKTVKGASVIFVPENKHNDVEKIKAGSDGTFYEDALVPGRYVVYAKKDGIKSNKHQLRVMSYLTTHNTPSSKTADTDSDSKSSSISASIDSSVSASLDESVKKQNENSSTKSSYRSKYKRVSLESFTDNPDKYDQKLIKVTGTVTYIQRNSDNNTMDYIVLSNSDNTAATVAEVEVEDMHSHHISEGSNITILGGGLTKTVKLNGKTLESDIIEDFVQ